MLLFLYLLFHIACGILAFGASYSYWENAYSWADPQKHEYENWCVSFLFALGGPLGLFAVFVCGGFEFGLRYRRVNKRVKQ